MLEAAAADVLEQPRVMLVPLRDACAQYAAAPTAGEAAGSGDCGVRCGGAADCDVDLTLWRFLGGCESAVGMCDGACV